LPESPSTLCESFNVSDNTSALARVYMNFSEVGSNGESEPHHWELEKIFALRFVSRFSMTDFASRLLSILTFASFNLVHADIIDLFKIGFFPKEGDFVY